MPATCSPPSPASAFTGVAAASFYIAAYSAMNVGIFAVVSVVSGYEENLPLIADYRGLIYRAPLLGSLLHLLPHLAYRNPLHRRLLRQVLLLLDSPPGRRSLARPHRPSELRPGCRLLPQARGYRSATPSPRNHTGSGSQNRPGRSHSPGLRSPSHSGPRSRARSRLGRGPVRRIKHRAHPRIHTNHRFDPQKRPVDPLDSPRGLR